MQSQRLVVPLTSELRASGLIFLSLDFLICKMSLYNLLLMVVVGINWNNVSKTLQTWKNISTQ